MMGEFILFVKALLDNIFPEVGTLSSLCGTLTSMEMGGVGEVGSMGYNSTEYLIWKEIGEDNKSEKSGQCTKTWIKSRNPLKIILH